MTDKGDSYEAARAFEEAHEVCSNPNLIKAKKHSGTGSISAAPIILNALPDASANFAFQKSSSSSKRDDRFNVAAAWAGSLKRCSVLFIRR